MTNSTAAEQRAQALGAALERAGYPVPSSALRQALTAADGALGARADPGVDAQQPEETIDELSGADRWAVPALIRTDDEVYEHAFDATGYLEQASDQELLALTAQAFRCSDEADQVGYWAEARSRKVRQLYAYLEARNQPGAQTDCGFEVEVKEEAALAWLRAHRPHLIKQVRRRRRGG